MNNIKQIKFYEFFNDNYKIFFILAVGDSPKTAAEILLYLYKENRFNSTEFIHLLLKGSSGLPELIAAVIG